MKRSCILGTFSMGVFSCAATLHVIMFVFFFLFCLSHPSKYELTSPKTNSQVRIQTHKTILDLNWLNVLRNSCTVPYLFQPKIDCYYRKRPGPGWVSSFERPCTDLRDGGVVHANLDALHVQTAVVRGPVLRPVRLLQSVQASLPWLPETGATAS